MGETTDNINEVISTGGNFALLAEVIEFLKKKRKKEEIRFENIFLGVPIAMQWKLIQLVTMRLQIQSLASLSGLRIWRCHELWYRSQRWLGSRIAVAVE